MIQLYMAQMESWLLREVKPGHFVRCTAKEFERYQNEQK